MKKSAREKIEDLRDMAVIRGVKEGKPEDYFSAKEIDRLFEKS